MTHYAMETDRKKRIGFTNILALILVLLLAAGLAGGFFLAYMSIKTGYIGSLLCYTAVFTPIGTTLGVVMGKIVDKSKAENTEGGIKFELAKTAEFNPSPKI